jgi:hypothetical protein
MDYLVQGKVWLYTLRVRDRANFNKFFTLMNSSKIHPQDRLIFSKEIENDSLYFAISMAPQVRRWKTDMALS